MAESLSEERFKEVLVVFVLALMDLSFECFIFTCITLFNTTTTKAVILTIFKYCNLITVQINYI